MVATVVAVVVATALILPCLAGAASAVRRRRSTGPRRSPDEPRDGRFTCKLRHADRRRWPWRRSRARWVHDVLLVRYGWSGPTVALAVRAPGDTPRVATRQEVRGLGPHPLVILLRLDDGLVVELAAAQRDLARLVGPFLAAAMGEPGVRRPHRPGGAR